MNPFNFFKRPPARQHVIRAQAPVVNIKRATNGKLRRGMWVLLNDKVGIVKDLNELGICAVMLVDADGANLLEVQAEAGALKQCKWQQIPEKRRAHLSSAQLNRLGYED